MTTNALEVRGSVNTDLYMTLTLTLTLITVNSSSFGTTVDLPF